MYVKVPVALTTDGDDILRKTLVKLWSLISTWHTPEQIVLSGYVTRITFLVGSLISCFK